MTREPTEMERRVATALSVRDAMDYHGADFCDELRLEAEGYWSGYVGVARAAIRAMYEPTPEMVEPAYERSIAMLGPSPHAVKSLWSIMIDAASPPEGK